MACASVQQSTEGEPVRKCDRARHLKLVAFSTDLLRGTKSADRHGIPRQACHRTRRRDYFGAAIARGLYLPTLSVGQGAGTHLLAFCPSWSGTTYQHVRSTNPKTA